jgi:hypothetical protein
MSFNNAPNRHGPTAAQWAAIGGLIQQRQQIGLQKQSLEVQNALLQGQKVGNDVLIAQLEKQQEIENNRKRERMLDLWISEFKHRGMSPLVASNLATAELNLYDLYVTVDDLHREFLARIDSASRNIKTKKSQKVSTVFKYMMWALLPSFILSAVSGAGKWNSAILMLLNISLIGFIGGLIQLFMFRGLPPLPPTEEQIAVASVGPRVWFQNRMKEIDDQLKKLPKSQLSDDTDFRNLVKSAIRQD